MARLLGAAIIFVLVQTAAQGQVNCRHQHVPGGTTGAVDVTLRMIPDWVCSYTFRLRDHEYIIAEPAIHGQAYTIVSPGYPLHRIYYWAKAGYLGPDTFTLERSGLTRRVRVHVTVTQNP